MSAPRLPDGFAVQIDRRVRRIGSGSALLGGSPTRLLRLSPTARALISMPGDDGRLEVRDPVSAELARALLDATVAHPRPASGPSYRDVTVVIPVRDNAAGLRRLLGALRGLRVIVVDDGSRTPVTVADCVGTSCRVELIRHDTSRGPAAARNAGLRLCRTEFVSFLDSDVVPRPGWLESLLGHFCDPAVALAAPRIVALEPGGSLLARYEAVRSSLDLGERESPVLPYGPVSYVPSAAIVCRRAAVEQVGGFDESLHCGEDVDLCWRLVDSGFRMRYEPIALVGHQHRDALRKWLSRKAFYGTSAAPLSARHPGNTAPLVISAGNLVAWLLLGLGRPAGLAVAAVQVGMSTRRSVRAMDGTGASLREAALLAGRGLGAAGLQLSSAAWRHYWPVTLAAALVSRRARRAALAAAVVDAVDGWRTRGAGCDDVPALGPAGYVALKRLDDAAYGAGLWTGAVRQRTLRPLRPDIKQ